MVEVARLQFMDEEKGRESQPKACQNVCKGIEMVLKNVMIATVTTTSTKVDRDDHNKFYVALSVRHYPFVPITITISDVSATPMASPNFPPDHTAVVHVTLKKR